MIVDDEPLARKELSRLVSKDPEFQITNLVSDGDEAIRSLSREKVDAVFLDIEMPGKTGLEVAGHLAGWEKPPLVIFATAYHQYAIEAFEAHAIDYVLKPFESGRIQKTLERIKKSIQQPASVQPNLSALQDQLIQQGILKKLTGHVRNRKDRIVIDPAEVCFFSAEAEAVVAHLDEQDLLVNSSLKDVLARLDPSQFVQTHKGYIVNINKIQKVSPMFSGNFEILMKGPKTPKVPLSRRYAPGLKALLGHW